MNRLSVFLCTFCANFSVMSVEMLGFRFFAPTFGTGIQVTGVIVAVVMLASSLGAL